MLFSLKNHEHNIYHDFNISILRIISIADWFLEDLWHWRLLFLLLLFFDLINAGLVSMSDFFHKLYLPQRKAY